jgi:hypothetical protein
MPRSSHNRYLPTVIAIYTAEGYVASGEALPKSYFGSEAPFKPRAVSNSGLSRAASTGGKAKKVK